MRVRRAITILPVLAGLGAATPGADAAVSLEPIGTFAGPVHVASDPSDADRLFVVEQEGRIVRAGADPGEPPFLDLAAAGLVTSGGERGLLSVAFAPDFETTGRLYVFYTRAGEGADLGDLQIDEFTAAGDTVPLSSRRPVLTIDHEQFTNHNGGQLQFGPDGYLYIGTGDGGGGGDPLEAAQDSGSLLGKILRIDPRESNGEPYAVPADNPFVGTPGANEIWSLGLRNPWRFSFDRATGDLLIGDVGQGSWEEVNLAPAPGAGRGVNFGWDCREGAHDFEPTPDCPNSLTDPIHEYPNPPEDPASVTGGYVVRDPGLEELAGRYLYADVYSGEVRSLVPGLPLATGDRLELPGQQLPVSFGEDACGRIYLTTLGDGLVQRFTDGSPADCPPLPPDPDPDPDPAESCAGRPTTLDAYGSRIAGTPGADVIAATARAEEIRGRGGADLICARGGADTVRGGSGDDLLRGGAGADTLRGGPGRDSCRGGRGRDKLRSC